MLSSWSDAKERGEKYYFTGKPCKRGHVDRRYASTGQCIACVAEHGKRNYDLEKSRQYQRENRETVNKTNKAWRDRNPEKVRQIARDYWLKNTEKCKQSRKDYKTRHR